MSYNKITGADLTGMGVVGQADTPALTALEMQNKVEEVPRAVIIPHFNSLIDSLDERDADVDTALSDRYTKTETDAAIARTVTEIGAGDMQKAVYDTDGDGVVDNAAKLGGKLPGDYMPVNLTAYDAAMIDTPATFSMRNADNSATDSLSTACNSIYGTRLWHLFSIKAADGAVQYAFPYGTNGFLMRNYNWWNDSWSEWSNAVARTGDGDIKGNISVAQGKYVDFNVKDGTKLRIIGGASTNRATIRLVGADNTTISEIIQVNTETGAITAGSLMPKSGGSFTGDAKAYETARTSRGLFNSETRAGSTTGTVQSVKYFIDVT